MCEVLLSPFHACRLWRQHRRLLGQWAVGVKSFIIGRLGVGTCLNLASLPSYTLPRHNETKTKSVRHSVLARELHTASKTTFRALVNFYVRDLRPNSICNPTCYAYVYLEKLTSFPVVCLKNFLASNFPSNSARAQKNWNFFKYRCCLTSKSRLLTIRKSKTTHRWTRLDLPRWAKMLRGAYPPPFSR